MTHTDDLDQERSQNKETESMLAPDQESLKLQKRIQELEATLQEMSLLHAADIQNLYKTHSQELLLQIDKTKQDILMSLTHSVVDTFLLAMNSKLEAEAFRTGMEMIYKTFLDFLHKNHIEIINPPTGSSFDPVQHKIISMHHSSEHQPNTIYSVLQPGYKMRNTILRPANVTVVMNQNKKPSK